MNKNSTCIKLAFLILFSLTCRPCKAQILKGRIESIFIDGKVKPPVELKAKAQKFDERLIEEKKKPRVLDARLKSFPAKLRGEWTGVLALVSFKLNESSGHEIGPTERNLLKVGRKLNVKFRFYTPGGGRVTMAPPYGKFQKSSDLKANIYMPLIDPSTGKQLPPPSGGRWSSLDFDNDIAHVLLLNKVTMLSKERVEQDLVVRAYLTDRKTGKKQTRIEEHIYDFERVGSFHLRVKLAEVSYDENGVWIRKELFEGDVH